MLTCHQSASAEKLPVQNNSFQMIIFTFFKVSIFSFILSTNSFTKEQLQLFFAIKALFSIEFI